MDVKDYIKIFEQSSGLVLVIDVNFIIEAASDDFIKKTKTTRENIIGCDIFDAFPFNPKDITGNGESKMRASFNRVIKNKTADTLPIVRYDIPKPASEGGGFEAKYWKVVNSPILDTNNNVKYIIQRSDDVTENETMAAQLEAEQKTLKQIEDSEKRYNMMLMKSPFAFAVLKGKNMVITLANDLMKEFWGEGKEVEGKTLLEILPEIKDQPFPEMIEKVYTTGIPLYANEILGKVTYNGQLNHKYFNIVFQPYYEADNSISGVTQIAYEVTEMVMARKKIEENEQRFETAVAAVKGILWTNNAKGEMVGEQQGWASLTGQSYEEYQGFGWAKAIHPDDAQPTIDAWNQAVREAKNFIFEHRVLLKDGNWGNFSIRAIPSLNSEGLIQEWIGVHTDITEQKQASQYARSLIEASLDPLVTISAYGKITDVNAASIKVTGISREKLIGTDFSNYFTEPKKAQEGYQQVFDKGFVSDYPLTIKHKDGNLTDVLYNASVFKDEKGNVIGVFAAARDVTEQKKASQYARSLIEASLDPLVTISSDGKITDVNASSIKVTGISREKLIGANFSNYFTEPKKAQEGYQQVFDKGFVSDYPLTIKHKDGNLTDVLYNASVYKDDKGNVLGVFAAARDVTEQKRISTELTQAKMSAELATRIAEEAVKSKQDFLSNMSHEIRTPMNAIIGFTNVLLKSKLEKTQEEYLTAIKVSGDALLVLINDILDLAKVDAGKMTFEQTPFNLATSLSAMLQLFDIKLKEKNLKLEKQFDKAIPKIIMGDPMRLRQIILNLISNAVKFTEVGKITMCVALMEEDAEKITIEFTVTDTGIGIHKNKLEHIFDDFGQATYENSRLYGGTGLGLTIVKKLIEQQDGTIQVESELGKGSAFSFQLSFAKTNQKIKHETEQVSNKQVDIKNISVLVAEDMPLNQLLIKILLADFGFEVDIADNGKIAIEKLQQKKYDLVLMDLQMPEMNGFDATDHVRKTMKSNIPIIALTADVTSIDVEKALSVGMNDYISKPIDEQILYSKIIKVLQKTE